VLKNNNLNKTNPNSNPFGHFVQAGFLFIKVAGHQRVKKVFKVYLPQPQPPLRRFGGGGGGGGSTGADVVSTDLCVSSSHFGTSAAHLVVAQAILLNLLPIPK
jgi:hypothetical protein